MGWMKVRAILTLLAATPVAAYLAIAAPGDSKNSALKPVDFDRDIRPILSDTCFACHGPDEKERKARLRLDLKEGAFKPLKSGGYAIVPGHPEQSEIIARATTRDEDEVMPPPKSGKKPT